MPLSKDRKHGLGGSPSQFFHSSPCQKGELKGTAGFLLNPNSEVVGMKNVSRTVNEPPLTRPLGTLSHEEREPKKLDGLSPRPLGEGPGVRVWS